jgi:predicted dehydrogenase
MSDSLRAAISGLGNAAWRFDEQVRGESQPLTHAAAYARSERAAIVAGCSPDERDRQDFGTRFEVPVFASFVEMLDATEVDIVSVCSPTEHHFEQVMACIDRAVPMIWLEKPPATSPQELDRLRAGLQGRRSTVLVNYIRRYVPCYRRLRNLYREEFLGPCRLIRASYSRGLELNGSHILDMVFFIVGEERSYRLEWVGPGKDSPSFALAFEDGVTVLVEGLDLPYHCIDLSITCSQGRAAVLHGGMTTTVERRVEHELFPGFFRLAAAGDEDLAPAGFGACMDDALRDLIRASEQGRQPRSSLDTAAATQTLIEKVRAQQGERP